jgi:hypothetical protein
MSQIPVARLSETPIWHAVNPRRDRDVNRSRIFASRRSPDRLQHSFQRTVAPIVVRVQNRLAARRINGKLTKPPRITRRLQSSVGLALPLVKLLRTILVRFYFHGFSIGRESSIAENSDSAVGLPNEARSLNACPTVTASEAAAHWSWTAPGRRECCPPNIGRSIRASLQALNALRVTTQDCSTSSMGPWRHSCCRPPKPARRSRRQQR